MHKLVETPLGDARAAPLDARQRRIWAAAGLAFSLLMLLVHARAGFNTNGVPDSWRDLYWATKIAHGEAFPLAGPPIYGLIELGPWWFYLLAIPIGLTGSAVVASVFVQLLAGSKYLIAWRLGTRLVDERFGLAVACSLALAGWSTIPLMFPSHTALIETTLLLLAAATWRCWRRASFGNALLLGLAAGACLNAHPTTASYVVIAGIALLARHRSWQAFAQLGVAAVLAALTLAPPWFDPGAVTMQRSVDSYVGSDVAVNFWLRIPELLASAAVGGAWNGFLLMTPWSPGAIRIAWFVYCACVVIALAGVTQLPRGSALRRGAVIAAGLVVLQAIFLVLLRPITPMWMLSSMVPPLAVLLGLGWYGWFAFARVRLRTGAIAALVVFTLFSLVPFGLYLREVHRMRVAVGVNPYQNVVEVGDRYVDAEVPYLPARRIGRIAPMLCGAAVVHARLAWMVEQTLGVPVRLACGHWPELRYGGRAGPRQHVAGLFARAATASGIEPDRVVNGMAFYENVTPIAPAEGGKPTELQRSRIHPDRAPDRALPFEIEFDARGADVAVLTNRFSVVMPLVIRAVTADGRPAQLRHDDGGSRVYGCADCAADQSVRWNFELEGVEDDIDLVVLHAPQAAVQVAR
ncbi:MAG: hypothetical protein ACREPX_14815 [Rhodanobacteraceae bacterium]